MQRWSFSNSSEYRRLSEYRSWLIKQGVSQATADVYAKSLASYCDQRGITSDDLLDNINLPTGKVAGGRQVFARALYRYSLFIAQGGTKNAV